MIARLCLVSLVAAGGCDDPVQPPTQRPPETPPPVTEPPPSRETCDRIEDVDWHSRTYVFGEAGEATLRGGRAERPSPSGAPGGTEFRLTRVDTGDLTGDAQPEAVLELTYSDGRNNPPVWLAVFTERDCTIHEIGTIPGKHDSDYYDIAEWAIVDGALLVPRHEWGPDDPHCCPTMIRTEIWRYAGGRFAEDRRARATAPIPE